MSVALWAIRVAGCSADRGRAIEGLICILMAAPVCAGARGPWAECLGYTIQAGYWLNKGHASDAVDCSCCLRRRFQGVEHWGETAGRDI